MQVPLLLLLMYLVIFTDMKRLALVLVLCSASFGYMPSMTNFNTGQVSPLIEARADYEKYTSSCRTLENMFVTVQGPALKRPGTKYIASAAGSVRLIPFEYSTDDAYILEFGDEYLRFYRNDGQILAGDDPYEISTDYDSDEIWDVRYVQVDNEMYLTNGSDPPQVLSRSAHDNWTIEDVDFETGPFLPENDTTTTITPVGDVNVGDSITLTASFDIFEPDIGASHIGSIWRIDQVRGTSTISGTFTANGVSISTPHFSGDYGFTTTDNADSTITLQRSTNNGISWRPALTALTDTDFDNPTEYEEDGAVYRVVCSDFGSGTPDYVFTITDNTNKGVVEITAITSGVSATATVLTALVDTAATSTWREGYWSDYRGWPEAVTVHQQRLTYGGSETYPQTIWFGQANPDDYTDFLEGTLDTSAFTIALPGQNPIRWLLGSNYLFIGTSGSCGKYGDDGKAITPTSPNYQEQTRYGSAQLGVVRAGEAMLYIERGARKVREFDYNLERDKYISPDLTLLSPEITDSGIKDIAFQLRPNPILWCVLNNGDIATLTYLKDQSVIAWTKQITDGDFESVAVISSGEDEDEVWVSVKRTIDGTDYRYIEQFQPFDWGDDQDDCWFVDSGLGYDSTATASFSGLDHLEAESISIWADGMVLPKETVSDGAVTIGVSSARVIVGLPYTAKLETLPIRAHPQDMAMNKKIKRLYVDFYKTGQCSFGNGADSVLSDIQFYQGATLTAKQDLFTSEVKLLQFPFIYSGMTKQTIYFESGDPAPFGIRAIVLDMEIR